MDVIVFSTKWQLAVVYLEDIFLVTNPPMSHIGRVRRLLRLRFGAAITLKPEESKNVSMRILNT